MATPFTLAEQLHLLRLFQQFTRICVRMVVDPTTVAPPPVGLTNVIINQRTGVLARDPVFQRLLTLIVALMTRH